MNEPMYSDEQETALMSSSNDACMPIIDKKTALLTFLVSLLIAASICMAAVLLTGGQIKSDEDKMNQLTAMVMKTLALGNSDQAYMILKAAEAICSDAYCASKIHSLTYFVNISSAIRKVDRWRSAGKFLLASQMIEELRKLDIPKDEVDLHAAIDKRAAKIHLKLHPSG